jgi:hypothetical protein
MTVERKLVGIRIQKFVTQCRPESGILIMVAIWPPTQTIWWPNSNFSGQSKKN